MEGALMGKLDGKVAVITGAAAGIGAATARLFASEGAAVVIADYNGVGGELVADEIQESGGRASAVQTNVARAEDVQAMIDHALSKFGSIDILMNNAGIGSAPVPIHETDEKDWDRVIAVDLKGVFLGIKYVVPHMIERGGGTIINVASIAGLVGSPRLSPYAAAKAGVIELTKVVAAEYSRYNIRCNTIAPGWTQTAIVDAYMSSGVSEEKLVKNVPMRRLGHVSEIAHTALFLASDEAAFVQGTTVVIDGGLTAV
jgi:NAD(P)-dependent dehydrogenase (short-subunit alcohol dehydrogenase family)